MQGDQMQEQVQQAAEQVRQRAPEVVQRAQAQVRRVEEQVPSGLYTIAVLASIAASALLFLSGRRAWGIFVGLWAPTIADLSVHTKLLKPLSGS